MGITTQTLKTLQTQNDPHTEHSARLYKAGMTTQTLKTLQTQNDTHTEHSARLYKAGMTTQALETLQTQNDPLRNRALYATQSEESHNSP